MKNEITISELARLMQVSVHQIRYFEEKEVLLPAYIDDNQYRMYGMDQVYQLAHILLLRKLGLSVQSIRECLDGDASDSMQPLLRNSLVKIDAEIVRLQQLSQFIRKVLGEHEDFGREIGAYRTQWRETLPLAFWFETDSLTDLHARMFAQQGGSVSNLFEADLHYIYDGPDSVALYTEAWEGEPDLLLPAGEYLSCRFLARDENELAQHMDQFQTYAEGHSLNITGPLVLAEKSYLSLFSQDSLHYEMFARIAKKD